MGHQLKQARKSSEDAQAARYARFEKVCQKSFCDDGGVEKDKSLPGLISAH